MIDEFRIAIDNYEKENTETSITDFKIVGGGKNLEEGEKFMFKVKLHNQSHLDMKKVQMRISGTRYADVSAKKEGPFTSYFLSPKFDLDAHGVYTTDYFYGVATNETSGAVLDIVLAGVYKWDASLHHILEEH